MIDHRIDGVLFDLDGTLVDSAPDLLAATNRVLADAGEASLTLAEFRPVVSKGARAMLRLAFPRLDEDRREALVQPLLDHYASAIAVHSRPFDGVESLLDRIERARMRWGIVTNKSETLAREVVHAMGWSERCAVLVGGDTLDAKKPDPAPLRHACVAIGIETGRCLYVGDDERDIQAARAAGMAAVAALWGYREAHEDPQAWGADLLIAHPLELCFELAEGLVRGDR